MFRNFIEWTEGDISRGRKTVLFSTIAVFLIITATLFGAGVGGVTMSANIETLYLTLVGLIASIYGFYTGTSSEKSGKLADKAADIMLKKMEEIGKK